MRPVHVLEDTILHDRGFISTANFCPAAGNKQTKMSGLCFVHQHLAFWIKISADDILKYFSYISQKISFDI